MRQIKACSKSKGKKQYYGRNIYIKELQRPNCVAQSKTHKTKNKASFHNSTMSANLGASFDRHQHEAAIVSEYGERAEHARNGLCPFHPDIQLRKKNVFGGWKTVRDIT